MYICAIESIFMQFSILDLRLAASVGKTLLEDNKLLEDQTKLLLEHKDSRTEDKQQQQIIDLLKQEHQELLNQYHSITTTNKQMKAEDDHAKLKVQLDTLYEKLENTYSIIERYDDERRIHLEQIRLQRKYEAEKKSSNKITNLSVKVDCISIENHALLKEKAKIEDRLRSAMQELKAMRDRVFALRELQEQYNTLNEKYHHQTFHVNQLELWIKECQNEPVNLFPKFSHEIIQGSSLFSEQQLYSNEGLDNQAYDGIDSYPCLQKKRHSVSWSCFVNVGRKKKQAKIEICQWPNKKEKRFSFSFNLCYSIWYIVRFMLVIQLSFFFVLLDYSNSDDEKKKKKKKDLV